MPPSSPPKAQELRDLIAWLRALISRPVVVHHQPPAKVPPRPPSSPPAPFKPLFGIDYAWGNPRPADMRRAGVQFVCRYLSHDESKDLRPRELAALRASGLPVALVWESTASRALDGRGAGEADAQAARRQLLELGLPPRAGIVYFAIDFDWQGEGIDDYFKGATRMLGLASVGVYGSFAACKHLLDSKLVAGAWQTYAWSSGRVEPRARLYQFSNGHQLGGVECDFDRALVPGYGQWR